MATKQFSITKEFDELVNFHGIKYLEDVNLKAIRHVHMTSRNEITLDEDIQAISDYLWQMQDYFRKASSAKQ